MVAREPGFTLVELMVTIAIIGFLAMVAAPYTISWIHEANVNSARSLLHQAHSKAKALALRNPEGEGLGSVAASVVLSDGSLMVCQGEPSGGTCSGSPVWQGEWPAGVTLAMTVDEVTVANILINNRGQILDDSANPINGGLAFSLSKGSVTYGSGDNEDNKLR